MWLIPLDRVTFMTSNINLFRLSVVWLIAHAQFKYKKVVKLVLSQGLHLKAKLQNHPIKWTRRSKFWHVDFNCLEHKPAKYMLPASEKRALTDIDYLSVYTLLSWVSGMYVRFELQAVELCRYDTILIQNRIFRRVQQMLDLLFLRHAVYGSCTYLWCIFLSYL